MSNKFSHIRRSQEEGFSLVELLTIVVVLGVLASIALVMHTGQQKEALKSGIKSDVRNVHISVMSYLAANPTATNLGYVKLNGTAAPTGSLATNPLFQKINTSDENTSLTLRGVSAGTPNGSADGYVIIGSSTKVEQGKTYSLYYFSQDRRYAETVS